MAIWRGTCKISFYLVGKSSFSSNRSITFVLLSLKYLSNYFELIVFLGQPVPFLEYFNQFGIQLSVFDKQFQILVKIYFSCSWNCGVARDNQFRHFCCSEYFDDLRWDFGSRNYWAKLCLYFYLPALLLLYYLFFNRLHLD